jgi:xanthine dehydrogenase YagS FAD-binding subunit
MGFEKAMERRAWTFALASVAAVLAVDGNVVREARIVLGGVANVPRRAPAAEAVLLGAPRTLETIDAAARSATDGAAPLSQNGYKVPLVEGLVRRALRRCFETEAS